MRNSGLAVNANTRNKPFVLHVGTLEITYASLATRCLSFFLKTYMAKINEILCSFGEKSNLYHPKVH